MNNDWFNIVLYASLGLVMISFGIVFLLMLRTKDIYHRIVVVDFTTSIIAILIILYGLLFKNSLFIDAVLIISLISFTGTVAISTYLKQKR